jgi:16S rRNA U516 pseudouridylate synthase RsuA-like enzyme
MVTSIFKIIEMAESHDISKSQEAVILYNKDKKEIESMQPKKSNKNFEIIIPRISNES